MTPNISELVERLEGAAKAATPGPWFQGHNNNGSAQGEMSVWPDARMSGAIIAAFGPHMSWDGWFEQAAKDAKFSALANPQNILALCAALKALAAMDGSRDE